MIHITKSIEGFNVRFSERQTGTRAYAVKAADVPEVQEAVSHYYDSGHSRSMTCPLCRLEEGKEKKDG